jgi:hypothetical protein
MPGAINGFGTTYYGCSDIEPDGSYLTTEWVTVFYVPIYPVGSWRVVPGKQKGGFPHHQQEFRVRPAPLSKRQVLRIYGLAALLGVGVIAMAILYGALLPALTPSQPVTRFR